MARNSLDDWERLLATTDELESPLVGSGIGAPKEEDEVPDINLEDAPVPMAPPSLPSAGRKPVALPSRASGPPRARGGMRDDLADAQAADAKEKKRAEFEAGLDIIAFRKPFQPRDVGSPNADALMKRVGLERQGKQDDRQAKLDEMNAFLNDAKVKAYLAKANAPAKTKADTAAAKAEADKSAAASIHEIILRRYGPKLTASGLDEETVRSMPLKAAEKLLGEMQGGRAVEAGFVRQEDAQTFTGGEKEKDRTREEERQTRERTINGRGLAHDAASAKTVREIDANTSNLETAIGTLKRLHQQYKGQPLSEVSDVDGAIAAAVENAQSAYRVYANLGVPSGKDAEMSNAAVNDPSHFKAMLLGRGPASWDIIIKSAKEQADAKARSYLAGPTPGGAPAAAPKSKARRVSMPDGTVWEEQPDGTAKQVK